MLGLERIPDTCPVSLVSVAFEGLSGCGMHVEDLASRSQDVSEIAGAADRF